MDSIPDRWLKCPRKSMNLIMDKFLAFKTPLDERYNNHVPLEDRWTPKMLLDYCKSKKIQLGLWIDLTNTSRFYDKNEIEKSGCKYIKLACKGHGETPSVEVKDTFVTLVNNFISHNPLHCIAVHCTHGFNRTGFLIVSYLVEKHDFSLEAALEMFAKSRPVGIYKEDYIRELYCRYDDEEEAPPPPSTPDWCFYNGENNLEASTSQINGKKNNRGVQPQFMAGVTGVHYFSEQPKAYQLQRRVQQMCGWNSKGFPGCQPVSMDMGNIRKLQQKPYRVSWKADGMRYMMLIDGEDEVYFFDRDNNVFKVIGLRFPHRKDLHRHLTGTLLDGEMVIDKFEGQDIPRYLVYDIVRFENEPIFKMAFYPNRMQYIEYEILRPRHAAIEQGIINRDQEPFSVRKKDFWDISQASSLLSEKFTQKLSHEPDGLIFQPSKEPYVAGRCDEVLKWKPLNMNSIDFRLRIVKTGGGMGLIPKKVGHLFVGQQNKPFAIMNYTSAIKDLDGKIVECKFENHEWKFMRERTDKSFPNSLNTANAVLGSIQNPVTKEFLLNFIHNYGFVDDSDFKTPAAPIKRKR